MVTHPCSKRWSVLCAAVILSATAMAVAQDSSAADKAVEVETMWRDFVHFIRIARADAALANGQALLAAKADPRAVYRLSVEVTDIIEVFRRGERLEGLADTVAQIRAMLEEGYRLERQDPAQIARAIDMLAGDTRTVSYTHLTLPTN